MSKKRAATKRPRANAVDSGGNPVDPDTATAAAADEPPAARRRAASPVDNSGKLPDQTDPRHWGGGR